MYKYVCMYSFLDTYMLMCVCVCVCVCRQISRAHQYLVYTFKCKKSTSWFFPWKINTKQ